jgi:hypothetical protein
MSSNESVDSRRQWVKAQTKSFVLIGIGIASAAFGLESFLVLMGILMVE